MSSTEAPRAQKRKVSPSAVRQQAPSVRRRQARPEPVHRLREPGVTPLQRCWGELIEVIDRALPELDDRDKDVLLDLAARRLRGRTLAQTVEFARAA